MHKSLCTMAVIASVSVTPPALAEAVNSPLVGLWKVDSITFKDAANQVTMRLGDHPSGYVLYTKGGHIIAVLMANNRTPPAKLPPTDAEAAKLFATMAAIDGTYKIVGENKFLVRFEDAANQSFIGVDLPPREFKISGERLTVTFTTKNPATGQDDLETISLERAE